MWEDRKKRPYSDQVLSADRRDEVKSHKHEPKFPKSEVRQDARAHAERLEDVDGREVGK